MVAEELAFSVIQPARPDISIDFQVPIVLSGRLNIFGSHPIQIAENANVTIDVPDRLASLVLSCDYSPD